MPQRYRDRRAQARDASALRGRYTQRGAPNVVIVPIDDMGFGVPSSIDGPLPIPTLDKLAACGWWLYLRFALQRSGPKMRAASLGTPCATVHAESVSVRPCLNCATRERPGPAASRQAPRGG
jgi:hypothetical protein